MRALPPEGHEACASQETTQVSGWRTDQTASTFRPTTFFRGSSKIAEGRNKHSGHISNRFTALRGICDELHLPRQHEQLHAGRPSSSSSADLQLASSEPAPAVRNTAEPSPLKARDGEDGAPRTVDVTRPASADSEVARPAVTAHPAGVPAQPDASACRGAAGGLHSPRQGDDESGPAPASAEAISGTPLTTLSLLNIRGLKTASSNAMPYVTDTLDVTDSCHVANGNVAQRPPES